MPDAFVGLAASAALCITDIPFEGPLSEVRVGRVDGKFIVNPYRDEMENSDLDLIVAGTANDITMVEGEMDGASEQDMIEALKVAHEYIKKQCVAQLEPCETLGGRPPPREYNHEVNDEDLAKKVNEATYQDIYDLAKKGLTKTERSEGFEAILNAHIESYGDELDDVQKGLVKKYFGKTKKNAIRNMVLETKGRLDGRDMKEVRQIWTEYDVLPALRYIRFWFYRYLGQ